MDDKSQILDRNYFLNKMKDTRKKDKFQSDKFITFIIAFIVGLLLIGVLYFVSPYSKTYKVTIDGNIYLKDSDVLSLANLSKYYLFTFPNIKEKEMKKSVLIDDVTITMEEGNIVHIQLKEVKQIGYIYEDGASKLLLIDDSRLELNKNNMYLIDKVPLIEGYDKDELKKIAKGFEDVDYEIINEISEIHKYPVSYDVEQMEVIMRDGNYCFLSSTGLKLLKNYYSISSSIDKTKGHACVYLDDFTNTAYVSICPWQKEDSLNS